MNAATSESPSSLSGRRASESTSAIANGATPPCTAGLARKSCNRVPVPSANSLTSGFISLPQARGVLRERADFAIGETGRDAAHDAVRIVFARTVAERLQLRRDVFRKLA